MEKFIIPKTTPDMEGLFNKIFDGALGTIIQFSKVPTSSDLNPNQIGFYGTDLYFKLSDGSCVKISGAAFT